MELVSMAERPGYPEPSGGSADGDDGADASEPAAAAEQTGTEMKTLVCYHLDADGTMCGLMVVVGTDEAAAVQEAAHLADHPDHAGFTSVS